MKYLSIAIAATALLCAQPARAHVHLTASAPADGSVLPNAPTSIMVKFSEAARLTALIIRQAGHPELQKIGPLMDHSSAQFTLPAPQLAPGVYTVEFRALDPQDGHISSGKFSFTIAPGAVRDVGRHPAPASVK